MKNMEFWLLFYTNGIHIFIDHCLFIVDTKSKFVTKNWEEWKRKISFSILNCECTQIHAIRTLRIAFVRLQNWCTEWNDFCFCVYVEMAGYKWFLLAFNLMIFKTKVYLNHFLSERSCFIIRGYQRDRQKRFRGG